MSERREKSNLSNYHTKLSEMPVLNASQLFTSGYLVEQFEIRLNIVINSHWEPSLPNAPGKDKLWEEASPEAKRSGS